MEPAPPQPTEPRPTPQPASDRRVIPVPGGPLAMDPSDLQVVEPATMAWGGSTS